MKKNRKTVFFTGATGNMGKHGLKQLLEKDKYNLKLLVLPTKKDKDIIAPYTKLDNIEVIYGDLTNYNDVLKGVTGADYVLHVGGMVSPIADYVPEHTTRVNIGATENIVKAIKSQSNPDSIKVIYIGTIAQTGDRNPPIHWGRTGDPIKISIYDNYAITKTIAEKTIAESGLKYWVSLRQTGMLYGGIMDGMGPIMFHVPFNGVFEWSTDVQSGRLLANVCDEDIPEEFWCRFYNIGGGEKFRTTNWEFIEKTFGALGIKDFRKALEPKWFATQNFHGKWYTDSDVLENYLHYRSGSFDDFINELKRNMPALMKLARYVPPFVMKNFVFKPAARKPLGTLYWIEHNDFDRTTAFFGSKEKWEVIPSWDKFELKQPSKEPQYLDHGYDESKPKSELDLDDMKQVAKFRGGKCSSHSIEKGDLKTKLHWECAFGHKFHASPTLVLLGGHWCPKCLPTPWNYDEEAKHNPFFAQVWRPLHSVDEKNYYDSSILKDIRK